MRATGLFVAAALAGGLGACSGDEPPFALSEQGIALPATLKEAYPLANRLALEASDRAYVSKMGGGFAAMNHRGESRHHSFVFHAREGIGVSRRIIVHLIAGAPWTQVTNVNGPPPPFGDFDAIADSDAAVAAALADAAAANAVTPDSIPLPANPFLDDSFVYAAKILSTPQWPEPNDTGNDPPHVAWRVDFLTERVPGGGSAPVPFTIARFYLHPVTLDLITAPIVTRNGELYPWP